jgi:hypothetical protein
VSDSPTVGAPRPAPLPAPRASLEAARVVLDRPAAIRGAGWTRSVVLLTRQALEDALNQFWAQRAPGMERATGKSRLVSLRYYMSDTDVARRAHHTWSVLSDATHYRGYDLAPAATELQAWLTEVDELIPALQRSTRDSPARPDRSVGARRGDRIG